MPSYHSPMLSPVVSDYPPPPRVVLTVVPDQDGQYQVQLTHHNCPGGWPQVASIIQTALGAAMHLAFEALSTQEPLVQPAHTVPPAPIRTENRTPAKEI